jgi:hypothetical protein
MNDRGPRPLEAAAAAQSITAAQLREFLRLCAQRYEAKRMDPGGDPLLTPPPRTPCPAQLQQQVPPGALLPAMLKAFMLSNVQASGL